VRIEPVISVAATDSVGPTRLRLLTAGSVKLPVVIVAQADSSPAYYVMDVATLQGALTNQLSATSITETLDLGAREPRPAVSMLDAKSASAGSPVVENGRLVGVIAEDKPEHPEPTEADMSRGDARDSADPSRKRGLWQRLSRSE
jgi:hypothetical protein